MSTIIEAAHIAEDLLHLLQETPETNLIREAKLRCLHIMHLAGCCGDEYGAEHMRLACEQSELNDWEVSNNDPLTCRTIY